MKVIGVTGNIGCGKTTVCKLFENKYNIPVFYSDLIGKEVIKNDDILISKIHDMFGDEVFLPDMSVNRQYILYKIFGNKDKLEEFNSILHPPIIKRFDEWKSERFKESHPYIIEESALIFETKTNTEFDEIIAVNCSLENRVKRASVRSGLTESEVRLIDAHQIPWIEKWQRSTLSILNHSDLTNLETNVDYIHYYLTYSPANYKTYSEHLQDVMDNYKK